MTLRPPKTKHEEIMNCIESTNDIVSKILEGLENQCDRCPIMHKFKKYEKGQK